MSYAVSVVKFRIFRSVAQTFKNYYSVNKIQRISPFVISRNYSSNPYYLEEKYEIDFNKEKVITSDKIEEVKNLSSRNSYLKDLDPESPFDNNRTIDKLDEEKAVLISGDNELCNDDTVLKTDNFNNHSEINAFHNNLPEQNYDELRVLAGGIKVVLTQRDEQDSKDILEDLFSKAAELSRSEEINWEETISVIRKTEEILPEYKPSHEELQQIRATKPTFTISSLVNESQTLQKLVDLGINLHEWERKGQLGLAVKLDFDRDVAPAVSFLADIGIPHNFIGGILDNPAILEQTIDDLMTRVNYLISKKFSKQDVVDIVLEDPGWLTFSVKGIDSRLGFLQKTFSLTGDQVRRVAVWGPRLVTDKKLVQRITKLNFSLHEEFGFSKEEIKEIILREPYLFNKTAQSNLMEQFDLLHNEIGIPHNLLVKFPVSLMEFPASTRGRHLFLKSLGLAQYDPKVPNYVSPSALTEGTDEEFCKDVAKCSDVQLFYRFLKTL